MLFQMIEKRHDKWGIDGLERQLCWRSVQPLLREPQQQAEGDQRSVLPLPADVGSAISKHLRWSRPGCWRFSASITFGLFPMPQVGRQARNKRRKRRESTRTGRKKPRRSLFRHGKDHVERGKVHQKGWETIRVRRGGKLR